MPTLKQALKDPMPPEAKVVHLALTDLGPGTYTAKELAVHVGEQPKGSALSRITKGARMLRRRKYIEQAKGDAIVAGERYAKPTRKKGNTDA